MDIRTPLVGFIVITLILAGYFWKKGNTAVPTFGHQTPVIPMSPGIGPIKSIVIGKDTLHANPNPSDNLRHVLEVTKVFVYSGGRRLGKGDFSGIGYRIGPSDLPQVVDPAPRPFVSSSIVDPTPELSLSLKTPMMISRVEILPRQDCCWERLAEAWLVLVDEKNNMVWNGQLRGVKDVQVFNM